MLAHTMISCLTHQSGTPWDLKCRQERVCESHFARVKRPFQGTPCIRDALYGTFLEHLKVYRHSLSAKWATPKPVKGINMDEAVDLANHAMQNAVFWMSFLSKSRSAKLVRSDLDHWWETQGRQLVAGSADSSEPEPELDDDEGFLDSYAENLDEEEEEVENDEEYAQQEADAADLLQACDAHMEVKKQISELQSELSSDAAGASSGKPSEDLAVSMADTDSIEDLSVTDFFMKIRQLPALQAELSEDNLVANLQRRMEEARPLLDSWCKRVRLQEKELSPATVEQKVVRGDNEWNRVQHELSLARQASMLSSGQRTSRLAVWAEKQQDIAEKFHGEQPSGVAPVRYLGAQGGRRQVVLYVCDGSIYHGLLLTVWRGAVLKDGTRRLRTRRPAAALLPLAHCGQVRLLQLVEATPASWLATSLCPCHLMDPLDVVALFNPDEVVEGPNRCILRYSDESMKSLKKFLAEESWKKGSDAKTQIVALPSSAVEGWNHRQFTPALAAKNVNLFLSRLPHMYSQVSSPLVDSDGQFAMSAKRKIKWSEVVCRAIMYFDTRLTGQSSQMYSSSVFSALAELHPSRSNGLLAVKKFVQNVDSIAPPWLAIT